jgi:hypothetical protein
MQAAFNQNLRLAVIMSCLSDKFPSSNFLNVRMAASGV